MFGQATQSDHHGEKNDMQETYNRSILDFVREGLGGLNRQLGVNDRLRVDEYLTSIREIERRLDAPPSDLELPKGVVRPTRVPESFKEHFRLMADLQILAIQMDVTRVSTFMLGVEQSRRTYNEIGIPEEHHGLTHHAGNAEKIEKVCRIDNYCSEQFAYFLNKLRAIKEGDRTLLDNSMIQFGSSFSDGNRHDPNNLPIILAGRAGGKLETGRHIASAKGTPLCNLYVSMLERMGTPVDSFGDSTGALLG